MNILSALLTICIYPIPTDVIQKICIERGLNPSDIFTLLIAETQAFQLAKADVYLWLFTSPDIKEQEIAFTQADRDNFLYLANVIYYAWDDPKFSGNNYGFVGENFNG